MGSLSKEIVDHFLRMTGVSLWHILIAVVLLVWLWRRGKSQLSIPTYGGILSFSRFLSGIRLATTGPRQYMAWYKQEPMVLIPRVDAWTVLVHSKYIDEMGRAPEDQLSFVDAASNMFQTRYNFGQFVVEDHYHHEVIKKELTRNLSTFFPDLLDEVQDFFNDYTELAENGPITVTVFAFMQQVVARASNRVFVGLPLCRDERWLTLAKDAAMQTIKVATLVNLLPEMLRPLIGRLISPTESRITKALMIIGPLVEQRLTHKGVASTSPTQDDYISWLVSRAPEHERNVRHITNRLLNTNFAAIHLTTASMTQALYWLLSRPHYIESLRTEIQHVTDRLGWTREAIGSMPKLDSFMKESMRMTPFGPQIMNRIALKPFTFSNGVQVPTGTSISSHLYATHQDESIYPHADVFDGFRFVNLTNEQVREPDGNGGKPKESATRSSKTMYSTSSTYLSFGHGKHACPGRFFASMEVKLIMAHLIANFDVTWPDDVYAQTSVDGMKGEGETEIYRPTDTWFGTAILPNQKAKMLLRKIQRATV